MIARVISMEHPTARADHQPSCNSYQHSKFVRRKRHVEERLMPRIASFGIDVKIFPAVIDTDFELKDLVITFKDLRLNFERGIIGCYLSHVMLWRLCMEQNCALLVLEDDALLPPEHEENVQAMLAEYDALPDAGDYLYLQAQLPYHPTDIHNYPDWTLKAVSANLRKTFPIHDLAGTAAYAIKPLAAQKLLDRVVKVPVIPVDGFMHGAVNARDVGVLVPADFKRVFMLDGHYEPWNHVHMPTE